VRRVPDEHLRSQSVGFEAEAHLRVRPTSHDPYWYLRSKVSWLLVSLYLWSMLPARALSSYLVHWVVEVFLDALERTRPEIAFRTPAHHREATRGAAASAKDKQKQRFWYKPHWFLWVSIYGAAAAASAVPRCMEEVIEKAVFVARFAEHIRWICQKLDLWTWEAVQGQLVLSGWEKGGFEGEAALRQLWEVAMRGQEPLDEKAALPVQSRSLALPT